MILALLFFLIGLFSNKLIANASMGKIFGCSQITIYKNTRLLSDIPAVKKFWSKDGHFTYYSDKWRLRTNITEEDDMDISYNFICGEEDHKVTVGSVCESHDTEDNNATLVKILLTRLGLPTKCPIGEHIYTILKKKKPEPELNDIMVATCSELDEELQFIIELTQKKTGLKVLTADWEIVTDDKNNICRNNMEK